MKITPMAAATNGASTNVDMGHSAGADRIARAKAVIEGRSPDSVTVTESDQNIQPEVPSLKRIKMRTNFNTTQYATQTEQSPEVEAVSDVLATNEQAPAVDEATQPLSPQFAALAKAKRALQAKEREVAAREAALSKPQDTKSQVLGKDQIQASLLGALKDGSLTYDDLTQWIMAQNPSDSGISELRAEIKALKEGFDKNLSERDQLAEQQVLTQIRKDVDQLIAQGDEFEAVREAGYAPKVVDLIHKVFKQEGEIMEINEAAALIENELIEESLRFARLKKVQGRLTPAQAIQEQQVAKPSAPQTKIMRTLTNRDGSSAISQSRRENAIAAMEGRLKR